MTMEKPSGVGRKVAGGLAIAIVCAVAIYFRTFALHHQVTVPKKAAVEKIIYNQIKEQLKRNLRLEFGRTDEAAVAELAERQAKEAVELEKTKFEGAVESLLQSFAAQSLPGVSRHYLLEADPYFYYYLTKEIKRRGTISPEQKGGKFFMALREIPKGAWAIVSWHPYAGYWWDRLFHLARPDADLMESLCYFPLMAVVVAVLAFFFLCRSLQIDWGATFFGAMTLVLAPVFIERSAFGWFDTDPYQFIFPFAILGCFFRSLRSRDKKRNAFLWAAFAGGLSGLYSLFWAGWLFIFIFLAGIGALAILARRLSGRREFREIFWSAEWYGFFALLSAIFFMTPSGFFYTLTQGFFALFQFTRADAGLWPNAFLTVGEAMPSTIPKLIYLSGNPVVAVVVCVGLVVPPIVFLVRSDVARGAAWFIFVLLLVGATVAALNTERFAVLFLIPVSVLVAYGFSLMLEGFERLFRLCSKKRFSAGVGRIVALCLAALLFLPPSAVIAYAVATRDMHLIMNDTWYESLEALRQKTPSDAVVDSWWPPGYFIVGVAERGILIDGGTQQLPQTYWMAKALLAPEESETLALLDMLNASGNDALDFLLSRGVDLAPASELVLQAASLNRASVGEAIRKVLGPEDATRFLDFFYHGAEPRPAYIFLYNDLIEQNLALSLMANWDFKKAEALREKKKHSATPLNLAAVPTRLADFLRRASHAGKGLLFFSSRDVVPWLLRFNQSSRKPSSERFNRYLDDVLATVGDVWRYTPKASEIRREGERVFFSNGLDVDLKTMEARVVLSKERSPANPMSLFYVQDGKLEEKIYGGNRINASALLICEGERWSSVLASPGLIRSTLFRLYYLKGETMAYCKPFFLKDNPAANTSVYIFEIDWKKFKESQAVV